MSRRREREPERVWVVPPVPELECCVCTEVFTDPVSLFCGHTFCRQCAVRWFAMPRKLCPAARCPASAKSKPAQLPPAYALKGVVDALRVYCRYGLREDEERWTPDPEGCPAHLLREEAAAHEAACAYAYEVCPFAGCGVERRRRDAAAHNFEHLRQRLNRHLARVLGGDRVRCERGVQVAQDAPIDALEARVATAASEPPGGFLRLADLLSAPCNGGEAQRRPMPPLPPPLSVPLLRRERSDASLPPGGFIRLADLQ